MAGPEGGRTMGRSLREAGPGAKRLGRYGRHLRAARRSCRPFRYVCRRLPTGGRQDDPPPRIPSASGRDALGGEGLSVGSSGWCRRNTIRLQYG